VKSVYNTSINIYEHQAGAAIT